MTDTPKDLFSSLSDVFTTLHGLETLVITMEFACRDPCSLEAAIQATEAVIDRRMAAYRGRELFESTIAELKAECRAKTIAQVAPAIARGSTGTLH